MFICLCRPHDIGWSCYFQSCLLAMFKYFVGPVIFWPYLQLCLAYILLFMAFTQSYDLAMFLSVCFGLVTSATVLLSVESFWPCLQLFFVLALQSWS